MRCLHCGKRLPLFRKFTDGEFCSDQHRIAYGREQEQLALSRLIDAQQQSQTVTRRREKKKTGPPKVDLAPETIGQFVTLEPELLEASWHGYQKEDSEPAFRGLRPALPRMETPVRQYRVPAACGAVWWNLRVVSRAPSGGVATVEPAPEDGCDALTTLAALERWGGGEYPWREAVAPDVREAPPAGPAPAAMGAMARIPLAGCVPLAGVVHAGAGVLAAQTVAGKPVALRTGWLPDAYPRAGLCVVAVEGLEGSHLESRFDATRLVRLDGPGPRPSSMGMAAGPAAPQWRPAPVAPRLAWRFEPGLRRPGRTAMDLGRMASGSFARVELMEGPVGAQPACLLPAQQRPRRHAGLLGARSLLYWFPQADWGRELIAGESEPEPLAAFLVPPRGPRFRSIDFEPPQYGLQPLRLFPKWEQEPGDWRVLYLEGPFVPAPRVSARPTFNCPPLCDWVPVRAQMMPLRVRVDSRPMPIQPFAGRPEPADPSSDRRPAAVSRQARLAGEPGFEAAPDRMRRISIDAMIPHQAGHQPKGLLDDEPLASGRALPMARLRLAKDRPTLEIERRLKAPAWKKSLYWAAERWSSLPAPAKLSGIVMTALLAVAALNPGAGQAGQPAGFQATLTRGWEGVQRNILKRAAVALTDDFRSGLAEWEGQGDWARAWSYDQAGFVRTGPLALYSPSLALTDYRMEFLGQIEKRSLGWVVRAADLDNYYAVKLTVAQPGPVPDVVIQRYAVIGGRAEAVQSKRLPVRVWMDTVYRVQTEVRDGDFALTVQDQVVDAWTDRRLKRGGVGFFSGQGELARLRWVGVWHQYDTLGRLCALLAPAGYADRDRGVNQ